MEASHKKQKKEKQNLLDFPIIKPGAGEKTLCIQRQHPIVLTTSVLIQTVILFFLLAALIFAAIFLPSFPPFNNAIAMTEIALVFIAVYMVFLTFTFLTWYYQFYIVTNRSILHRYCFRIAGPFSEIVYAERMHVRDIDRSPPNLLCDFLKIEDVRVHFRKLDREEPFVFKTPEDAQAIEDIIHDLVIISKKGTYLEK